MVADDLAMSLSERYARAGASILDPFCGSGRFLEAAAHLPGKRFGVDVNPLACLVTQAKLTNPDPIVLRDVLDRIRRGRKVTTPRKPFKLREARKVQWFTRTALTELSQIVSWINELKLGLAEQLIVAAVLSATSREASFARQDGWKLHRLASTERDRFSTSPWNVFERRLQYCVADAETRPRARGTTRVQMGDARFLAEVLPARKQFDLIMTSPPYGDSKTTVQYGAASALCLEFVSRLTGFEELFIPGREIDRSCLGGLMSAPGIQSRIDFHRYWAGRDDSLLGHRVRGFLTDYEAACASMVKVLKRGGVIVIVVGQRATGGYRLKLDKFTKDQFEAHGMKIISVDERRLREKRLPRRINRFGRSASPHERNRGLTPTMMSEAIIAFQRP